MSEREKKGTVRKPRADAARNHALLLATGKALFAEKGEAASLEEIARRAGVGIGTLYRHFPTRDALVDAVYRNEAQQLGAAAAELAARHPPIEALHAWLLVFVDYLATKQGLAAVLNARPGGPSELHAESGAQMQAAMSMLVENAVAHGDIEAPADPFDLLRALAGVANYGAGPNWQHSARHMVDVLIAGIRSKPGGR